MSPRPSVIACCLLLWGCHPPVEHEDDGCPRDPIGSRSQYVSCGGTSPATPATFSKPLDALASYDAQTTCDPTAKPGVIAFRDLVLATYKCTGDYGIARACNVGGTSEHKEGRAWDWKIDVGNAAADDLINWLLATDAQGNKYANARRVGIMYMVWNRQIWGAYRAADGWRAYTGSDPHTNHVHISFSWNGANKTTSFWSGSGTVTPDQGPAPDQGPPPPKPDSAPVLPDSFEPTPAADRGGAVDLPAAAQDRGGSWPPGDLPGNALPNTPRATLAGGCSIGTRGNIGTRATLAPSDLWPGLLLLGWLAARRRRR